jgi:hydrogenase/urease accessory protein HupE
LRGKEHGRNVLIVLPAAWIIGGLVGLSSNATVGSGLIWLPFVVLGGLIAADFRLPVRITTGLAMLLGLFHGYLNGSALGGTGPGGLALLGIAGSVFVLVTLISAFAVGLTSDWSRIAGRVVGSWIAASGLLLLGWSLRENFGII